MRAGAPAIPQLATAGPPSGGSATVVADANGQLWVRSASGLYLPTRSSAVAGGGFVAVAATPYALPTATVVALTLAQANTVLQFPASTAGVLSEFTLLLKQDATGSRTVTWPGAVTWPGTVAPTLQAAAGAVDVFTFFSIDGGVTWIGVRSNVIAAGQLVGISAYNPAVIATYTTSSAAWANVDTVNAAVTFVVPASGRVVTKIEAFIGITVGDTDAQLSLGPAGGAPVAGTAGDAITHGFSRGSVTGLVTGLAPFTSLTWVLKFATSNGQPMTVYAGGNATNAPYRGPLVLEVLAA